jgi:hypothetical protein
MTPPDFTTLERRLSTDSVAADSSPTISAPPAIPEKPTIPAKPTDVPPTLILRVAQRYLDPPILSATEASGRITAFVYGHLVVLGAMLALLPTTAVSGQGALTILGAGLSTFIAHAFADMLGRRIGHGHRSVLGAIGGAARHSLPILTAMIAPIGVLAVGGWLGGDETLVQLGAELLICVRIGMVGATAERFRGRPSSHRFVLVGVGIAVAAASVSIAKVAIGG